MPPPVPEAIKELEIPQKEFKKEKLKKDLTAFKFECSMVRGRGFEPPSLSAPDRKSVV